MPRSTITSKRQTTVPKEVCDALDVGPGDQITWEVNGGRVAVTTERPGLRRWKGPARDVERRGHARIGRDARTHEHGRRDLPDRRHASVAGGAGVRDDQHAVGAREVFVVVVLPAVIRREDHGCVAAEGLDQRRDGAIRLDVGVGELAGRELRAERGPRVRIAANDAAVGVFETPAHVLRSVQKVRVDDGDVMALAAQELRKDGSARHRAPDVARRRAWVARHPVKRGSGVGVVANEMIVLDHETSRKAFRSEQHRQRVDGQDALPALRKDGPVGKGREMAIRDLLGRPETKELQFLQEPVEEPQ